MFLVDIALVVVVVAAVVAVILHFPTPSITMTTTENYKKVMLENRKNGKMVTPADDSGSCKKTKHIYCVRN